MFTEDTLTKKSDPSKKLFAALSDFTHDYYKAQISQWKKDKRLSKSAIISARLYLKMAFYYHYLEEEEKEFNCYSEAYKSILQLLTEV